MSRRNQSRRRRAYGRRQHEVRERRPSHDPAVGWTGDATDRDDWLPSDNFDEPRGFGQAFEGYLR